MRTSSALGLGLVLLSLAAAGCSDDDDGIDADELPRRVYLGLDAAIGKSVDLALAGFNMASSADLDPQTGAGDDTGTLTITGKIDPGTPAFMGTRLRIGMVDYSDGVMVVETEGGDVAVALTYDTSDNTLLQPQFDLILRDIPDGTIEGSLTGIFEVSGDLDLYASFNLKLAAMIEDAGGGEVARVAGTLAITGTVLADRGTYQVGVPR